MKRLITILALLSTSVTAAVTKKNNRDSFANTTTVTCVSDVALDKEIVSFHIDKHFKGAKPIYTRLVVLTVTESATNYIITQEKIGQTLTTLNNVSRKSHYSDGKWLSAVATKLSDKDIKRWLKAKEITIRISSKGGSTATEQLPKGMLNCLRGL